MEQYQVTGMSCAACSARVEKAVLQVKGVSSCSVNLLTNSMGVEGSASSEAIVKAVEAAGYGASLKETGKQDEKELLLGDVVEKLKKRLVISCIFLFFLMYLSMGHSMLGLPVGSVLHDSMVLQGLVQGMLALIIMFINRQFFISGWKSVMHKAPNMDTLVALGSGTAFLYSLIELIRMYMMQHGESLSGGHEGMGDFYFESAAMIVTLITVGKLLEAISKGKTTDAIQSLLRLSPKTATVIRDEKEMVISIEEMAVGDVYAVKPGEQIPVDGVVLFGNSAVNESSLTGESIPVDKAVKDMVYQGTMNQSGYLKCQATKVGEDTTLSQIIRLVSDAAASKAPIAKIADRVSGVFVPVVICLALLTFIVWILCGENMGFSLARGISVLVISCPCALGLATPVAIMVGNGVGARNGIMFKTAVALEETGKADIVVLDKTGTLTQGKPKVTNLFTTDSEEELLKLACSLEKQSEHPLAYAIVEYGKEHGVVTEEVEGFQIFPGNGLQGVYKKQVCHAGNERYIAKYVTLTETDKQKAKDLENQGKTVLFFAKEKEMTGMIAVADSLKEDSVSAVKNMKNLGLEVVMLTGDHPLTAKAISAAAGVDSFFAGVRPDGKEKVVRKLQEYGKVIMVGDGINDAPALTAADMGMAIGAGADVAIDAADVVLMKSSLMDVAGAIRLSRATLRNIHQNLFWAFFYNCLGIPLAAGVFIPIFHLQLNPMFGAAAMSLSSFFVVTNALRLNLVKIYSDGKRKEKRITEEKIQELERLQYEDIVAESSLEEVLINEVPIKEVPIKEIPIEEVPLKGEHTGKELVSEDMNCKKSNAEKEGEQEMTKTMKIEGMMCGHCEARVKKVLEALPQVKEAKVSHEAGCAEVILSEDITDEVLKKTVEDQDYKVISIS